MRQFVINFFLMPVVCDNYRWNVIIICMCSLLQQFGPILDVEIIFNERGSKVRISYCVLNCALLFWSFLLNVVTISNEDIHILSWISTDIFALYVYIHTCEFIRAYVIIILIFLELNNLKMLHILAFYSSFLNYLNGMLIDSEIIMSVIPWRFLWRYLYEIHIAWTSKLLKNVSFIVIVC